MVNQHPDKELLIKKGQFWELWLISPTRELILGAFQSLEELNQAQITLYQSWERSKSYPESLSADLKPSHTI